MQDVAEALRVALEHHQAGRLDAAENVFRQVLAQDPNNVAALNNLGNVLRDRADFPPAVECFRRAVALVPHVAELHYNLANALRAVGQKEQALESYRQAITIAPHLAVAHNNLGTLLKSQGDLEGAERAFAEAVRLEPKYADAHYNLGNVQQARRHFAAARSSYQRSLELRPDNAAAHYNLGTVWQTEKNDEAARAEFLEALRIQPRYPEPLCNLGILHLARGEDEQALAHFEQALAIDPECPEAHFNRGAVHLAHGNYAAGWPEYAWHTRCPLYGDRQFDSVRWQGEPLEGRTLLVHCHHGMGDTLQFSRLVGEVRRRGAGRVLLAAQEKLHPLLSEAGLDCELVSPNDVERELSFDVYVSLMSLPGVLQLTDATIPGEPYLRAAEARVAEWREALSRFEGFRVGIAWQGNRHYAWDHLRSIPLAAFEPLAGVPGVQLMSLQFGFGREQLADVAFPVTDLSQGIDREGAFVDTAAIIANLDLVISSDTALAHLAGALGARTWTALPCGAEWRWQRAGKTTPWYGSMQLFRQTSVGRWDDVFAEMARRLQEEVAAKDRVSKRDGSGIIE
ncbi:MAG: tetratricopeptide repeat protein [Planctomycetota bacterium]|nr:MAG: tetratricopeptide repeat protein [Planctomycetota bacterium]